MTQQFYVKALWDADASVWFSETDIPGLVLQTETLAEFEDLIRHFAPDLLASNLGIHEPVAIRFEAARQLDLAAA
ncbi:DUF1902 domain-containing protein [Brevundimonas sp.]|jgi:hypothetical protein|uniref:DUF1902 domain-containing protein n=1 Tax=Brevundimonas sp. TaxID=1871086 RepID=UPI002E0F7F0B|nr:DUF1902 domain-containing protein [Brevundimonas sp.]